MINRKIPLLRMSWDFGDQYGSTMGWAFGIADALYLAGEYIPDSWAYRPGASGPSPTFESDAIADAVASEVVTWDDVRALGAALLRYRERLEVAGLTY